MKEHHSRMFLGFLIILVGLLFLLDNMDKLDADDIISDYWPMILILAGIWHLLAHDFRSLGLGFILIAIGAYFQLEKWGIIAYSFWNILWPALIICAGLWLIIKPRFRGYRGKVPDVKNDDFGIFTMFSGVKRRIESKAFRGGKATALFGGIELDFTRAELAGKEATLDLSAVFGGIDVWVPREWKVVVDTSALFGAVDDKHNPLPEDEITATLYVKATTMFGGIDIKN